jgi:hypothetical protein
MFLAKSNPAVGEAVRKLCGARENEKYLMAESIAREGTSNDIYCSLVFGRFEIQPPDGGGPYRSAGRTLMPPHLEKMLCDAYIEKTRDEIALLKGVVKGAREVGERASAAIEEREFLEVKGRQVKDLRSMGLAISMPAED